MAYLKDKKHLHLGETHSFDKVYEAGSFIIFYSPTYDPYPDREPAIDNTSVIILSVEGDHLLHISFRRAENQIVFNSCPSGPLDSLKWGKEELIPLQGVFSRTDITIAVRLEADKYEIYIDDSIIHTFTKRIRKNAQKVTCRANRESRAVFANPIGVVALTPQEASKADFESRPSLNYQEAYFNLTPVDVAKESEKEDGSFDYVIIGSGIGGGILAADLLDKNRRMSTSFSSQATTYLARSLFNISAAMALAEDPEKRTKRILVVERGNLLFPTHSLNMPRPSSRGTYGQMNDLFYNHFKQDWRMDDKTRKIWKGGPVYCLGGRSTVWGLFSPRIADDTFRKHFPGDVYNDLNKTYLRKAEESMNISYP
ncbi:hypothetical protein PG991_009328 [Apiospora marii]|uniref:Galectin n=1 Tax=Apiospora marii TaxID=335849 RepID=A0ABR1RKB1_9PEZI